MIHVVNFAISHPAGRRNVCFSLGSAVASEKVGGSIGMGIP